jgi:hypothetical protein
MLIDTFMHAVARIPGLSLAQSHEALRAAKLLRRHVEAGRRPSEEEWQALFPFHVVRQLAQIHLDEGPGEPLLDAEATLTGGKSQAGGREPGARSVGGGSRDDWYVLLTDVPDEGLPLDGGSGRHVDSWELRRLVYSVSRGWEAVDYHALPTAGGFRDRFVDIARRTDRLACIRGLPRSA